MSKCFLWLYILFIVVFVLLAVSMLNSCFAHEEGSPFAEWFNHLKMADQPTVSCCGEADQHYPDSAFENDDGSFTVVVDQETVQVPRKKVDWNAVNPTGRAVIFLSKGWDWTLNQHIVYCFIPGSGV
jgi:hypothetical protein